MVRNGASFLLMAVSFHLDTPRRVSRYQVMGFHLLAIKNTTAVSLYVHILIPSGNIRPGGGLLGHMATVYSIQEPPDCFS